MSPGKYNGRIMTALPKSLNVQSLWKLFLALSQEQENGHKICSVLHVRQTGLKWCFRLKMDKAELLMLN